jgi:hypothetical protein
MNTNLIVLHIHLFALVSCFKLTFWTVTVCCKEAGQKINGPWRNSYSRKRLGRWSAPFRVWLCFMLSIMTILFDLVETCTSVFLEYGKVWCDWIIDLSRMPPWVWIFLFSVIGIHSRVSILLFCYLINTLFDDMNLFYP